MPTAESIQRSTLPEPVSTSAEPMLSVIVPAYQCAGMLRACLDGLAASDLPRASWELLVVDDGSTDDTARVAATLADRVVTVAGGPRGPAHARNQGAQLARGDVLVFVDADVVVAPTTLSDFARVFSESASVAAAFGAYDDTPADPGIVSQYRNLLHRFVHTLSPGDAATFWAGCGAVRSEAFFDVDGFDDVHFPRPQIEDIDLGYRLRAHGERIVLVPSITGKHLKRWTLTSMIRTDLLDRAIPWIHLLLRRTDVHHAGPLNLGRRDQIKTGLAGLAILLSLVALVRWDSTFAWMSVGCIGGVLVLNTPLLVWLVRRGYWRVAFAAVPLRVLFYMVSAVGAGWAIVTHARQHYTERPALRPALTKPISARNAEATSNTATTRATRPDILAGHKFEERLRSAFAPMDARALGLAIGFVAALAIGVVTALSPVVDPTRKLPLQLLRQFFPGYSVSSSTGPLIGAGYFLISGFVGGWMLATVRNVVIAVWLLKARIRTELPVPQNPNEQR